MFTYVGTHMHKLKEQSELANVKITRAALTLQLAIIFPTSDHSF